MSGIRARSAAAAAAVFCAAHACAMSPLLREIEASFVRLHEEVRPCVVSIETRGTAPGDRRIEEFFHLFGQPAPGDGEEAPPPAPRAFATGSGFIYDRSGHIVTNNHVVDGVDTIKVKLWNGKEYDASVVGQDPESDLAVIKVQTGEELPAARLGDSGALKVGQFAIALGSPRGFEGSLTFGHISALGRDGLADLAAQGLRFQDLIQTDAGINLGNSGGPLCNIDGEVIGINVAIVWGAESLGFAIPIDMAKTIVPQLISEGRITRGFLGVRIEDTGEGLGASVGLGDSAGAFVTMVQPGTPAARAGLKRYDVIRKINGEAVADASDLVRKISAQQPGATIMIELWRDRQPVEAQVQLDEWKAAAPAAARREPLHGMLLEDPSAALRERFGLGADAAGAVVVQVEPGSPAEDAGLSSGDLLIEVAQQPVSSVAEVRQVFAERGTPGAAVSMAYVRGDEDPNVAVLWVPR